MAFENLILVRKNDETNLVFDKQINFVEDLKLSKELGTPNISNEDSTLIIKSANGIHISDVIQVKINLTSVGIFLVNFKKESFNEENRKTLLDSLSSLKDKVEPTLDTQTEKTRKILTIINEYNPIYVTFLNNRSLKIDIEKIASEVTLEFPLLVLAFPVKKQKIHAKNAIKNKYFDYESLFITLFSLLFALSFVCSIHGFFIGQMISAYLIVVSLVFTFVLSYVTYNKIKKSNDKILIFALAIYSLLGWIVGSILGVILSKYVLTEKDGTFELTKVILIGGIGSLLLSQGFTFLSLLIKKIVLSRKMNK